MSKKLYSNSWAARLTPDERWAVYEKSHICHSWDEAATWAKKEFGLEKMPSRTAWFRWREGMAKDELAHRMQEASLARCAVEEIAKKNNITNEEVVKALISEAVELAYNMKDHATAVKVIEAATRFQTSATEIRKFEENKRRVEKLEAEREEMKRVAKKSSEMTDEERNAKICEILGI